MSNIIAEVWTPSECAEWIKQADDADSNVKEIRGTIFRQQVAGSIQYGFQEYWGSLEETYKSMFDSPIPSKYRSSKSVIKTALDDGVKLTDNDGQPLGKTAIEKARKESQPRDLDWFKGRVSALKSKARNELPVGDYQEFLHFLQMEGSD